MKLLSLVMKTLPLTVEYTSERTYVEFDGGGLKQDKITYAHGKKVNIYIVYNLESNLSSFNITLKDFLYGEVMINKSSSHVNKYQLLGYGIGYNSRGIFSHPSGTFGQNVITFGADLTSSAHANNRTKHILILGEGITQIADTTLTAERIYSINFSEAEKKFC